MDLLDGEFETQMRFAFRWTFQWMQVNYHRMLWPQELWPYPHLHSDPHRKTVKMQPRFSAKLTL
eukprot:7846142-Ditylum_brightwellii.AAC.2